MFYISLKEVRLTKTNLRDLTGSLSLIESLRYNVKGSTLKKNKRGD